MTTKNVSKKAFVYGHVATICFHVILAILIIFSANKCSVFRLPQRKFLYVIGGLLLVVSLLAFVPIFQDWDKMVIE